MEGKRFFQNALKVANLQLWRLNHTAFQIPTALGLKREINNKKILITLLKVTHQMGINDHTGLSMNFTQTSMMYHHPEEYPNEDCAGEACLGKLV